MKLFHTKSDNSQPSDQKEQGSPPPVEREMSMRTRIFLMVLISFAMWILICVTVYSLVITSV